MQTQNVLIVAAVRFATGVHREACKALRDVFAPYMVMDSYGSFQQCYTTAEALEWLPYMASSVVVTTRSGRIIARRKQGLAIA